MKHLAFAFAFAMSAVAGAQDKDEVSGAAKKTVELKNYEFKGTSKLDGNLPFGGGGGGPLPETKFTGAYDAGTGLYVSTETNEWVTIGGKTVTRPKQEWRVVDPQGGGGGGRGFGGMGRGMMGMFGGTPKAPHDDLKDFGSKLASASKKDAKATVGETECTVFECELTEDAAKEGAPMGRMLERIPDAEIKGKAKVWMNADGAIVQYDVTVSVAAEFQGMGFEISSVRSVLIYNVDKAKVEIPSDAKKAIEKADRKDE